MASNYQKTVLVAEDNPDDTELIQIAFECSDLPVNFQTVFNGQQAIDYLEGKDVYADRKQYPLPSVIISDIEMPYVSGIEFLAWLKKCSWLENIPVVLMSSARPEPIKYQLAQLGSSLFLEKTSHFRDLVDAVRSLVA